MARVIVPAALAGAVDEEDTGAERPFLCYKKPVARRPCAAISVFRVPHFTDLGGFATSIRSQPIEAGGQVVLPDGRVTPRLPVNPEGRARDAVCKSLPGTSVRSTSAAGAAPRPHFQNHLRRRPCEWDVGEDKRACGDGDNFLLDLSRRRCAVSC